MAGHMAPWKTCEQDAGETRWQPGSDLPPSQFKSFLLLSLPLPSYSSLPSSRALSSAVFIWYRSFSTSHFTSLVVVTRVSFFLSDHASHLPGPGRKTKQELVMKMIALDGQRRAVSIREADILRALHHPHIVRCWNGILERGRAEASVGDVSFTSE